jgi:simple sugar transport system permease protein
VFFRSLLEGLGVLAGALAGGLLALVVAFLAINRGANQLAAGIAVTLFGLGVTSFAGRSYVASSIHGLDPLPLPVLSGIPILGEALFRQDLLTYIAYALEAN